MSFSLTSFVAAHASSPSDQASPTITDWITALATVALGVLGFLFTWWQWRVSGFRPHYDAKIDASRTGISLQVYNRGRALGIILDVRVAQPDPKAARRLNWSFRPRTRTFLLEKREDVKFASFDRGLFEAFELPGLTAARIVITTKPVLTPKHVLRIQAGTAHIKTVKLVEAENKEIRFIGLSSLLPPGSTPNKTRSSDEKSVPSLLPQGSTPNKTRSKGNKRVGKAICAAVNQILLGRQRGRSSRRHQRSGRAR